MNLTQIIEKAEKEYGEITDQLGLDIELEWGFGSRQNKDFTKIESFLSEKIKEAYEAGEERGSRLATDEAFDLTT